MANTRPTFFWVTPFDLLYGQSKVSTWNFGHRVVPSADLSGKRAKPVLRHIAKLAGLHYACPLCMSGFATARRVLQHCEDEKDEHHRGLQSEEQNEFLAFYGNSMGQMLECDDLKINYDEYGRPDFRECFLL